MLARLFAVSMLATALLPLASAVTTDAAPNATRWVEARMDLAQPTLTEGLLTGTLDLHKHRIGPRTYTATEMSEAYQEATPAQAAAFLAQLEAAVKTDLESMLAQGFPDATRTITKVDVAEATLTAAREDAFTPAIRVDIAATIVRSPEALGIGTLSDDALAAAFAAGADVGVATSFVADPGYDVSYLIHAPQSPAGVTFTAASAGTRSSGGDTVLIALDNAGGRAPAFLDGVLHMVDASVVRPESEQLSTAVDVRLGKLAKGVPTVPLEATIETRLAAIDVATRFPDLLPPAVDLATLSADGLRALRQAGAVSDASLDAADEKLLAVASAALSSSLGADAALEGGLSREDLAAAADKPYDGAPPVRFLATAQGAIPVPGAHPEDADLALALGATVRLDLTLAASSGPTTYRIHPPPGAEFVDVRGGTVTADGLTATFDVAGGSSPVGVAVRAIGAQEHTAQVADVNIVIDLHDIDIAISEAMNGDMGDVLVDLTVTGNVGVVAVPEAVKGSLGGSVELDYLSSDAMRLLRERGLLTQAQLDDITASLLQRIRDGVGAGATVEGGFVEASLSPALVQMPASADTPIVFEAKGSFRKPLSGGADAGSAAMDLYTVLQTFDFPRIEGFDTTYTVVLPRGLAVTGLEATGGEAQETRWSDGREAFTVTPSSDTAHATVGMSVTPTFVLIKFWPLVLGAVVLLVLLVGTPIALVVLRRRRGKGGDAGGGKKGAK